MPLVTGNSVGIDITGNSDKLVAESNRVIKELDRIKSATKAKAKEVEDAAKREEAALKKNTSSWTEFRSAYSTVLDVVRAGKAVFNFAKEGAQLEFVQQKFDNLSESIGTTSEVLMRDLKSATGGIYSDMQLMASATDFVGLGLAKTHDEAVRLAAVSGGLNMNMNQLVLTLTNMTTMRFDALGVRVDGFKEKVAALEAQGYSADAAFKEAFLQQAEAQLKLVGNAADTAAGDFMKLEAQIDNFTTRAKQNSATALLPLVQHLNETGNAIDETRSNVEVYNVAMAKLGGTLVLNRAHHNVMRDEIDRFATQMERGALMTEFYTEKFPPLTEEMESTADAQADLEESSSRYMSVLGQVSSETESYNEKNQELLDKLAELTEEQANTSTWSSKYDELNDEIAVTQGEIATLAEQHNQASQKIIFDLISQQAAANGFKDISVAALAKIGEEWGVLAQGSGEAAATAIAQADAWTEALANPVQKLTDIIGKYKALKKLSETGIVITAEIVYNITGGAMGGIGGGSAATECFTGDTMVTLGDGSHRPIRDIQKGDAVLSYDTETKQQLITIVTETIEHVEHNPGRLLLINNHLRVTEEHALWNGSEWKHARFYDIGDLLMNIDGSFQTVTSIAELPKDEPTYNLHVDHEVHNYFAGGVLVHNAEKWTGGMVGSFANGGNAGGWAVVGDKQGGGFIPGVSELIFGNARVFNSRESEKMLRSGMFGDIKGLAFGGDTDGYTNPAPIPPIYTPPAPKPGGRAGSRSAGIMLAGGSGGAAGTADAGQMQQTQQAIQIQQAAIQQAQQAQQENKNLMLELISSVKDLPAPIGKEVAYQVAVGS